MSSVLVPSHSTFPEARKFHNIRNKSSEGVREIVYVNGSTIRGELIRYRVINRTHHLHIANNPFTIMTWNSSTDKDITIIKCYMSGLPARGSKGIIATHPRFLSNLKKIGDLTNRLLNPEVSLPIPKTSMKRASAASETQPTKKSNNGQSLFDDFVSEMINYRKIKEHYKHICDTKSELEQELEVTYNRVVGKFDLYMPKPFE